MKALRLFGNILVWPLAISKPLDRLHHSRLLRILRRLVFGLVLVVFWLLVFVLAGGLGPLITHAGAPIAKAFGIPLTVGKCVILPLGGYVRVENLTIANPDAFVSANPDVYGKEPLAKVGLLECDVAMRSLLSREIAVDTLQLTGLRALYAYDLDTTNVDALLAQMGIQPAAPAEAEPAPAPAQPAEGQPQAETPDTPAKEPLKFRLAYVRLEDNSVSFRKFVTVPIALPALTLKDVSSDDLQRRIDAVVEPAVKAVQGAAEGVGALGGLLGDGAKEVGTDAKDALDDGAKAVGNLLEGLLGTPKKKGE